MRSATGELRFTVTYAGVNAREMGELLLRTLPTIQGFSIAAAIIVSEVEVLLPAKNGLHSFGMGKRYETRIRISRGANLEELLCDLARNGYDVTGESFYSSPDTDPESLKLTVGYLDFQWAPVSSSEIGTAEPGYLSGVYRAPYEE